MFKKIILFILLIALAVTTYIRVSKNVAPKKVLDKEKVHYHAGFIVFENGKKIDFSDLKYMFIKPCGVDGKDVEDVGDAQIEKAHLHDNVGDVVHIESLGAVWGDLFSNIKYPIDYSKVTAFVNGQKVSDIKNRPIEAYDSLVLFIGSINKNLLTSAVSKDHILLIEKTSKGCSD